MSNSIEFQLFQFNKQIPFVFKNMNWDVIKGNVDKFSFDQCNSFVACYPVIDLKYKTGLYIYSKSSGTGKTSLAICTVGSLIQSGKTKGFSLFKLSIELMEELGVLIMDGSSIESSKFFQSMMRADLIILDDVGVERLTESMATRYYYILDKLWRNRKHVIMTSKYSVEELIQRAENNVPTELIESIASRISGLCNMVGLKNEKDCRI